MCLEKIEAFRVEGKLYEKEIEAVDAKLALIGRKLFQDHAQDPRHGLLKHGEEIGKLITRRAAISECGNASSGVKKDPPDLRSAVVQAMQDNPSKAKRWLNSHSSQKTIQTFINHEPAHLINQAAIAFGVLFDDR